MNTVRVLTILSCLTATALLAGCTAKPVSTTEAEGIIEYDGEPVQAGIVSFVPIEPESSATYGGAVNKGKYRVYPETGLRPGKYRVEIRWGKPTGEKNKDAGYGQSADIIAEAIPEKYNAQSVLTAELKEGQNTVDFKLEK